MGQKGRLGLFLWWGQGSTRSLFELDCSLAKNWICKGNHRLARARKAPKERVLFE